MACNKTTISRDKHIDNMESLFKRWISKPNIKRMYKNSDGTTNWDRAERRLKDFAQYKLDLPFDVDYSLNKRQIRRLEKEIDGYANDLRGQWSNVLGIVPEGISKQDPISRKFYLDLNEILNKERVNVGTRESAIADVTSHMLNAYVNAGQQGKYYKLGIKAINDLRDLRRKAMTTDDPNNRTKFEKAMQDLINGDQGVFINQFKLLSELNKNDFSKVIQDPSQSFYLETKGRDKGKKVAYDPRMLRAAEASRTYLSEMSRVYVNGLDKLKEVVDLKYGRFGSNHARRIKDDIDAAIKGIQRSDKEGGYWPGMFLQNLVDIKINLDKMMPSNKVTDIKPKMTQLQEVLTRISGSIPDSAREKNRLLNTVWDKDPLFVLGQYGKDVVGFNKLVHTQAAYLKAMRDIPKTNSTKFLKGLQKFITEEYAVFTEGTSTRPDWVNEMVYYANAFQTARTMGFNITGAVKNAASAIHYFTYMGRKNIMDAQKDLRHNSGGILDIVTRLEKDAGYKFTDPASELFSEGLIKRADFEKGSIEFNPVTGKIEYKGSQLRDATNEFINWGMGNLLVFHRMTENWQRRWMFRTAFTNKYKQLINNSSIQPKKAEVFAKNYALRVVNGFAYEYAPHAKHKWVRGDGIVVDEVFDKQTKETNYIVKRPSKGQTNWAGIRGGLSEITYHLLHYPMSLAETHLSSFRGAKKAVQAKQWDSDELSYMMRYGTAFGLLQIGSILANTDLNNIFENETISRMQRIEGDLMLAEPELKELFIPNLREDPAPQPEIITPSDEREKKRYGLLSEVFGPTMGHIKYGLIATGVLDLDENSYMEMLFGNVDFSDDTEEAAQYTAYQYSTEWGKMRNKNWPAIKDGRGMDILRHWLSAYPSQFTKKYHDRIFGEEGLNVKGRKKKKQKKATLIPEQNIEAVNTIDRIFGV